MLGISRIRIRFFGLIRQDAACADITADIIFNVGIGVNGYASATGMDKVKAPLVRVYFRYDAYVVDVVFASAPSKKYQIAFAQIGDAYLLTLAELIA